MKTILLLTAVLIAAASLAACGENSTVNADNETDSALSAENDAFYISPLGNTNLCLQMVPTSAGLLAEMGSCSGISPTRIRYMNGGAYNPAQDGNVTISVEGQCLTNPAAYGGGPDAGQLFFKPCNDDGREYGMRQMIDISRNQHGAAQIASNLQYMLNVPGAQRECMERPTPTSVKRTVCSGLGNWMTWR